MESFVGGNAGRINTSGWSGVLTSLLCIFVMLFLYLLLSNLFIRGLAIFEPQEIWELVCSQSLLGRKLNLKISCERVGGLRLGYGSMSWAVTSRATLIYLSEDKKGLEAGFCLNLNCLFD